MDGEQKLIAFLKQYAKERKASKTRVVRGHQLNLDINYILGEYKNGTSDKRTKKSTSPSV
jgi:hypothetical protein